MSPGRHRLRLTVRQRILGVALALSLLAAVPLAGLLASPAAPAQAAPLPAVTKSVPLNWCPASAAACGDGFATPAPPRVHPRARIDRIVCSVNARVVDGSARWFYVGTSDGVGFLRNSALANPPAVPDCSTAGGVQASLWTTALAQYGHVDVGGDANRLARAYGVWADQTHWSGNCVMFSYLAWMSVGVKINERGNGPEQIWPQVAKWGKAKDPNPPRGALVFWKWNGLGHVAISLGNQTVMTTVGAPGDSSPTALRTMAQVSQGKEYLGSWLPRPY